MACSSVIAESSIFNLSIFKINGYSILLIALSIANESLLSNKLTLKLSLKNCLEKCLIYSLKFL